MSALAAQRTLSARLRSELYHNVCLLSLRRPMLEELCRMLSGGAQALDKLNQALLVHLSYYFATIIDPRSVQLITWPLYDRASERTYKAQLLTFISPFYNKNASCENYKWITPIQASYLSAGGFKVMQLLFEMSQLALTRCITIDFVSNVEKAQSYKITEALKNKSNLDVAIQNSRKSFTEKSINFLTYKKRADMVSEHYKKAIVELEKENETLNTALYQCISSSNQNIDELKNLDEPSTLLFEWNEHGDEKLSDLEHAWNTATAYIVKSSVMCRNSGKATVSRSTHPDQSAYLIQHTPGVEGIKTSNLESEVSSHHCGILRNIIRNDILIFPNLLRGYVVAACYLLKNVQCMEVLAPVLAHMEDLGAAYGVVVDKGKWLVDELHNTDGKYKEKSSPSSVLENSVTELTIPALPDIRIRDELWQHPILLKTFTPLNPSKIHFSMRNAPLGEFRQPRLQFIAPTHISRPSIFRSIAKLHNENLMTSFDSNTSTNCQPKDMNRTTADCSSGFTKEQVYRLLSSRKSSTKKKVGTIGSHGKVKRSCLFEDTPENSFVLTRSASSPNIAISSEVKRKNIASYKMRSLHVIVQEDSPDRSMEMSGIACLNTSGTSIQQNSSLKRTNFQSMPTIMVSKPPSTNSSISSVSSMNGSSMVEICDDQGLQKNKTEHADCFNTPKTAKIKSTNSTVLSMNGSAIPEICDNQELQNNKTEQVDGFKTPTADKTDKTRANSVERLIEKYKNIRMRNIIKSENVTPTLSPIIDTSILNKENNVNEMNIEATIVHLPDLVSPNCNILGIPETEHDWLMLDSPPDEGKSKCRKSLGTRLGVEKTFLDQFDLPD